MSSGEQSSKVRVDRYADLVETFVRDGCGLPEVPEVNADRYLAMSGSELRKLPPQELADAAFDLSVAAYAARDLRNRQYVKADRCRVEIARLVGDRLNRKIYGIEEQWRDAAFKDEEAKDYWLQMQMHKSAVDRLDSLDRHLADIAKTINNIIYERRS